MFEDDLYEKLRDTEFMIAYLEAAKEDSLDEFLFALREVVDHCCLRNEEVTRAHAG